MKTLSLFLVFTFIAINSVMSQLYVGANIGNEHYSQTNSVFQHYSSIFEAIELKYQIKKINLCIDYNNISRVNNLDNDILETQNNRFSFIVNYLQIQETQRFNLSTGFGIFARLPYQSYSKMNINYGKYFNVGLTANIAVNFFIKSGNYFSLGYRFSKEFYNSQNNNSLMTNDYGFYFGISTNFKK